jgi:hypothetical protein
LKWNRDQVRWVVGLLTGHCHLKRHLFKLELTDDPTCEWCLEKDESTRHILCDCESIKISSPGPVFLWNQVTPMMPPTFHSKFRIDKGLTKKKGSTVDHWRLQCKGRIIMAHPLFVHSFIQ